MLIESADSRALPLRRVAELLVPLFRVFLASLLTLIGLNHLIMPVRAVSGAYYYVDSAIGSDANTGTAPDHAWKTLVPVNGRQFQPGDVVQFRSGSSWNGGLVISASGVQGSPITFRSYGEGERPIFRNPGIWTRAVTINANWIVLEGITVRDAHEFGVLINRGFHHNVIQNCMATQVGIGFGIFGQHNLVTRSVAYDLLMVNNTSGGDDDYGAVGVVLYDSYNEVSYNRFTRCAAFSYDYGTDGGAVELYGAVVGSHIHHNWASNVNGFIEVGGAAEDTVVAYNVSQDSGMFSYIHLSGAFGSVVRGFRVENNTIVQTPTAEVCWVLFGFSDNPSPDTFALRNNIAYVGNFTLVSNKSTFTHDHNLYYLAQASTVLGFPLGVGKRMGDPLFTNLSAGDYHLRPNSPAIDAGSSLGYALDYDGHAVPLGAAPDLGVFEFAQATATPSPSRTPTAGPPSATPSPTRTSTAVSPSMTPSRTATITATRTTASPTPIPQKTRRPRPK